MTRRNTIPKDVVDRCRALNSIVVQTAINLVSSPDWNQDYCAILQSLGTAAQVDRLVLVQQSGNTGIIFCQWTSENLKNQREINCGENPAIESEEYIAYLKSHALPVKPQFDPIGKVIEEEGSLETSLIVLPIGGVEDWGWLVIENCSRKRNWHAAELDALRAVAVVISAAITRSNRAATVISSEIRLRNLFEQIPAVVYTAEIDESPRITWVSPQVETYLGWKPGEYIQSPGRWIEQVYTEDRPRVQKSYNAAILTRSSLSADCRLIPKNGNPIWFRHAASILYDNTGKPNLIQGVLQDINQSKNIEAELNRLYHDEHLQRLMVEGLTVTSTALSATMDVNRIPDILLQELAHILPYDTATFWLLNDHHLDLIRARGYSLIFGEEVDRVMEKRLFLEDAPFLKHILESGKPIIIESVTAGSNQLPHGFSRHIRSWAGAPILVQGKPIGLFTIESREEGRFNQKIRSILSAICGQAGLSFQNANSFQVEKRLRVRAEMLQKATAALTAELDLSQLLEQVIDYLGSVVPFDSVCIFLLEEENNAMRAVAGRGFPKPDEILGKLYSAENSLFLMINAQKQPLILDDTWVDPRFERWGGADHIRGWMGVPLIWHEKVIGIMTMDSRTPNAYNDEAAQYAQAFANQAASAIQISRMFTQLQSLALTDPLTGVINRRQFFEFAGKIVAKAKDENQTVSAIMIDVDNYKKVNDTHGHLSGDQILKVVSNCFKSVLQPNDLLSRVGGDEFVVLLPNQGKKQAEAVAERLRSSLENAAIVVMDKRVSVTASFGVAEIDRTRMDLDEMINRADQALYQSKNAGRNTVR